MTKEEEIMDFLHKHVFDSILKAPKLPKGLKGGINLTIARMKRLDADGMIRYFHSAVKGEAKDKELVKLMKQEGFTRFEDIEDKFDEKFNEEWLKKPD